MSPRLETTDSALVLDAVRALRDWQREGLAFQFHAGDLGWNWQFGPEKVIADTRVWTMGGRIVAVGMSDGTDLLRMTLDPELWQDHELARALAADLDDPARGVLGEGEVSIESPTGAVLSEVLREEHGWQVGEEWSPLRRDLSQPVEDSGLRIETVSGKGAANNVSTYCGVHQSAFGSPKFIEQRWHNLAASPPFEHARSIIGFDADGHAVAMATVWSAGPGKPGILEPLGAHADFRGKGYGRAIAVAAAAALQEMGASSAQVATPSTNVGAVAAYASAGYERLPQRFDTVRLS